MKVNLIEIQPSGTDWICMYLGFFERLLLDFEHGETRRRLQQHQPPCQILQIHFPRSHSESDPERENTKTNRSINPKVQIKETKERKIKHAIEHKQKKKK